MVTGRSALSVRDIGEGSPWVTYLSYVEQQVKAFEQNLGSISNWIRIAPVEKAPTGAPNCTLDEKAKLLFLMLHITDFLNRAGPEVPSIDSTINWLVDKEILRSDVLHDPDRLRMQQFIFATVGSVTMLYIPVVTMNNVTEFQVDPQVAPSFTSVSLSAEHSERSMVELLLHFGSILPMKTQSLAAASRTGTGFSKAPRARNDGSDALHLSTLNVETLMHIGRIQICWVDTVSAHLEFSPVTLEVAVFRLPSFCSITAQGGEGALLNR